MGNLDIVGVESSSFGLKLYEFMGCKRIRTTASHPAANGMVDNDNLNACSAEFVYGPTLRLPGEFLRANDTTCS